MITNKLNVLHPATGSVIAEVSILFFNSVPKGPRLENSSQNDQMVKTQYNRHLMSWLRSVPHDLGIVTAFYPNLNLSTHLNGNNQMDIYGTEKRMLIERNKKEENSPPLPVRLIAPSPHVLPDDGALKYAVVTNIADVSTIDEKAVILIGPDDTDLLRCMLEYSKLFGCSFQVLDGLPEADYSAEFRSITFPLAKISYPAFIAELAEFKRLADASDTAAMSQYDKERAQFTRADGTVKEQTKYKVVGDKNTVEDDIASDLDGDYDV